MCDNLIDLSIEDVIPEAAGTNPSIDITTSNNSPACLISAPKQQRHSLDNNPFDSVQKLADRPDDPFEIVEKQACIKARRSVMPVAIVEMANLLSLSDDNVLDGVEDSVSVAATSPSVSGEACGYDSTVASSISSVYHSANDLNSESPPISMSNKWTPESGISETESGGTGTGADSASSTDGSNSAYNKNKRVLEQRKRLLKLSISNSTFNTPISRHGISNKNNAAFSEDENNLSPISSILYEAAKNGEHLISSESPLKLVDDDLMSEEPPNFLEGGRDFDADLEMLKIPILDQLPSPVLEESPLFKVNNEKDKQICNKELEKAQTSIGLSSLDAIRAKLRARRTDANNHDNSKNNSNQDIPQLIQNLKSIICDIDVVDELKKQQAKSLLESLSAALNATNKSETEVMVKEENEDSTTLPQPIIRQGTFDLELQENEEKQNTSLQQYIQSQQRVDEMPDAMIKSSATYDGDTAIERDFVLPKIEMPEALIKSSATYDGETATERDFELPKIEPLSPIHSSSPKSSLSPDVNDIIEQLSKLLEQQRHNDISNGTTTSNNGSVALNPTFIVVMNTPQVAAGDKSLNESLNDFQNQGSAMRRRSQSLSLHDKIKIIQFPMQLVPPTSLRTAAAGEQEDSSPPLSTNPNNVDDFEFKTPARVTTRRNSFSCGTPNTPTALNMSSTGRRGFGALQSRRSSILETQPHNGLVRPMPMLPPQSNLNTFKHDVKKKVKSSNNSVMTSRGPLKATLPMKKVAPLLKASPPTPNANSSMHLLRSGKMAYTSTPMPITRTAPAHKVPTGYPSACSTPTVLTSPMRRSITAGGGISKPRYSYTPATPNSRMSMGSAATAGALKRRTLTEFKAKSPLKTQSTSMAAAATAVIKSTIKTAPNSIKYTSRLTTSAIAGRTTNRLSARASFSGASGINKNKENKQP